MSKLESIFLNDSKWTLFEGHERLLENNKLRVFSFKALGITSKI